MQRLIKHFQLSDRSLNPMKEFCEEDEFTFLCSIKKTLPDSLKLIGEIILFSISDGSYDARSHYLIVQIACSLGIPRDLVELECESIYDILEKASKQNSKTEPIPAEEATPKNSRKKIKKYLMIGLASLGGGAIIGVTGGLTAPIVASAFAGVLGGSLVMSTAAVGITGSLFGIAGAGLTASKMNRRIGDLEEFEFETLNPETEQTSLCITIAISGWVSDESPQQFTSIWKNLRHTKEQYTIRYESKYLLELSQAMDYLLTFVVSYATQEALKYTFLASVMAAIAWPTALLSIANIIDNPWDVCVKRSTQAGVHLANVLMSRQQGKRPASLIGFSLGARVIFFCLQELAKNENTEGLIGDVILLGSPVTASVEQWQPLDRIVSGTIINGYSSSDWLLKFLYRTSNAELKVAGLQEVKWDNKKVKNIDLTRIVTGHSDYSSKLNEILDEVGVHTQSQQDILDLADSGLGVDNSNSKSIVESATIDSLASICFDDKHTENTKVVINDDK